MHERLSIHSICFPQAPLAEIFDHWAALGARRVSFSSGQLQDADPKAVQSALARNGQQAETITHVFCPGPLDADADAITDQRARLSNAIAMAVKIRARSVYMLTGGRGAMTWEQAAEFFAAAIAPGRAQARDAGIALAVENTSPFYAHGHIGNNLRDTITLAELAGISLCMDYFACWTEADMQALIARAMPRLILVQVSDYILGDNALPCRAVPGDGAIPWSRVLFWLREAGYEQNFDLELIGPRIDAEGQQAAVRRAADFFGTLLTATGV
jgi:sugar phosphate isomerase/epimerase